MVTVCCDKDATKDLTPKGYTWTGCQEMPEEPKPTCEGNQVCCSQGLQGNVGYYCWEGPLQAGKQLGFKPIQVNSC